MSTDDLEPRYLVTVSVLIIIAMTVSGMLLASKLFDLRSRRVEYIDQGLVAAALRKALLNPMAQSDKSPARERAGTWQTQKIMSRCTQEQVRLSEATRAITLIEHLVCRFDAPQVLRFDVYLVETAGYNPAIRMLVIVEETRQVRSVAVLSHDESLDFGARLLASDSDWLASFSDRTRQALMAPLQDAELDAVSGATITAEAIRRAVADTLQLKPYTAGQHE